MSKKNMDMAAQRKTNKGNAQPKNVQKCSYDCIVKNAIIQNRNDSTFIIIVFDTPVLSYDTEKQEFTERETIAFSRLYIEKILVSNVIGYDKMLKCVEVEDNENSTNALLTNLLINANVAVDCIPYHIGDTYITTDGEQKQFENNGVQPRITALSVDMDTLLKVSQLINILPK